MNGPPQNPYELDASGSPEPGSGAPQTPTTARPTWTDPTRPQFTCVSCGYRLSGLAIESLCPECGTPVAFSLGQAGTSGRTSGAAIASLVLGIVSIVGCAGYGLPSMICGPLAIYFASQAKKQVRTGRAAPGGLGLAQAGLVCGIIGSIIGGLALAFIAFAFIVPLLSGRWP